MDISPINRDVIYRTRSAGSNISQYIGSTRDTYILIILVHSVAACNLQHIYSALQLQLQKRSAERKFTYELISSITLYVYILLSSNFSALLCQLVFLLLSSQSVDLFDWPLCFTTFLKFWNITAIYRDWLYVYLCEIYRNWLFIYLCEIYRQYIGTDCTRSALARQMKF